MIIFGVVLLLLFVALGFVANYQNKQQAEGNPFGKETLNQATIDQLDDPLYENQILPDELETKINNNEAVTVYFYSPTCVHCQNTTPIVVPMTKDLGIDMKKLNLLEFEEAWGGFGIEGTPTIVHYEGGEEVARISGEQPKANFEEFFEANVLTDES